jgi:hypothetical protein
MEVTVQLHNPAALPPGKEPLVMIGQEGASASLNAVGNRKNCTPVEIK